MYELQVANMRSDAVRFTSRRFEMLDARGHVTVEQGSGAQDEGGGVASPGGTLSLSRLFFLPQPPPPPPPSPPRSDGRSPSASRDPSRPDRSHRGEIRSRHRDGQYGRRAHSHPGERWRFTTSSLGQHSPPQAIRPPAPVYIRRFFFRFPPSNQRAPSSLFCFFDVRHRISGLIPLTCVYSPIDSSHSVSILFPFRRCASLGAR